MRISIPSIPASSEVGKAKHQHTLQQAAEAVYEFLQKGVTEQQQQQQRLQGSTSSASSRWTAQGKEQSSLADERRSGTGAGTILMTGAGVSVDSGIAPYRGEGGHYEVHKTYRPIFFHEFVDSSEKGHIARQRYWSRSFLGYPPVLVARPNKTHYAIAAMQRLGAFADYITQNVDSLHHMATPSPSLAASSILELHGTLQHVLCVSSPTPGSAPSRPKDPTLHSHLTQSHLSGPRLRAEPRPFNTPTGQAYPKGCGFRGSRSAYQSILAERNPMWDEMAKEMHQRGTQPKTNPDGDVELARNTDYSSFHYPACPSCGGVLKPGVVFFGESVPDALRDRSFELVRRASQMLIVGSSTATYSAYRLAKTMHEAGGSVMILNKGPSRADPLASDKIELGSSEVLQLVAQRLAGTDRRKKDPVLDRLLTSGGPALVPNSGVRVAAS